MSVERADFRFFRFFSFVPTDTTSDPRMCAISCHSTILQCTLITMRTARVVGTLKLMILMILFTLVTIYGPLASTTIVEIPTLSMLFDDNEDWQSDGTI
jgi:hypothetical protein